MRLPRQQRPTRRIYPRIPPPLAERLAKDAAAQGVSEASIVTAALQEHYDRLQSDSELILTRLDRLGRAIERVARDGQLHAETHAAFVRLWLGQTPPVPKMEREAAHQENAARFQDFLKYVAGQLARGGFLDQLPVEPVADRDEIDDIRPDPPPAHPTDKGRGG